MFSFLVGIAVPLVMVFWGEMLQSFSEQRMNMFDQDKLAEAQQYSTNMIFGIFGGGIFGVCIYFIWYFFLVQAKRGILTRLRLNIFKSLISRDYTFWNEFKPQEITQFVENELT
jgi:hypothetical protein